VVREDLGGRVCVIAQVERPITPPSPPKKKKATDIGPYYIARF